MSEMNQDNKFVDKLFDAKTIKETPAFSIAMAGIQYIVMFVISFVAAQVSIDSASWLEKMTSMTYWFTFIVYTVEQFYIYNVAYRLGIALLLSSKRYKEEYEKSEDLLDGVMDDKNEKFIIPPMSLDSAYIKIAIGHMNREERRRLFDKMIDTAIETISGKIMNTRELKKPKLFKKIRMKIRNHKIDKLNRRLELINNRKTNKSYFDRLDDKKIRGYVPIDSTAIISNNSTSIHHDSKWQMIPRTELERKGATKMAMNRFIAGIVMPLAAFGSIGLTAGAVLSMITLMIMQSWYGWQESMKNFQQSDLYNATKRYEILQEVRIRIPKIKAKETEEKRIAEEKLKAFRSELAKKQVKLLTGGPMINDTNSYNFPAITITHKSSPYNAS